MNGDSEQNGEHPESRQPSENKLQSIRDITEAIKDGDEKYVDRLGVLADALADLNVVGKRMIDLLAQIRDSLKRV